MVFEKNMANLIENKPVFYTGCLINGVRMSIVKRGAIFFAPHDQKVALIISC